MYVHVSRRRKENNKKVNPCISPVVPADSMRTNLVESFPIPVGWIPVAVAVVAATMPNMDSSAGPITDFVKFALAVDSNCSIRVAADEYHFEARDWRQAVNLLL